MYAIRSYYEHPILDLGLGFTGVEAVRELELPPVAGHGVFPPEQVAGQAGSLCDTAFV